MSKDEIDALADCVAILLDDIRKNKTPDAGKLGGMTATGAGDDQAQHGAGPDVSGSLPQ